MAETGNGGKEMSMETRLLLAFLLMGAVMFLTPYFFPSATPPAKKGTAPMAQTGQPAATAPAETAPSAEVVHQRDSGAPTAPVTEARSQPTFSIDTDLFHVTFSNQ